jgi:hypothetical protein
MIWDFGKGSYCFGKLTIFSFMKMGMGLGYDDKVH